MIKSLHSAYTTTQASVDFLKTAFDDVKLKQNLELKKIVRLIVERQDMIEMNQVEMSCQLTMLQTSVELLVSILLGDDVKKGETISKSSCTHYIFLRIMVILLIMETRVAKHLGLIKMQLALVVSRKPLTNL